MDDWLLPVLAYLARGTVTTLWISVLSLTFATVIGLLVGSFSASRSRIVAGFVRIYVELFRGVPSLLILLYVFFALPHIGIETSPTTASMLGLGLWGSANIAEVVRGAIGSISRHQTIAARALGMGATETLVFVIFPQALRRFLPPYVGQLTVLVQASALTSVVGVADLLGSAKQMIERLAYVGTSGHAIEIYAIVLGIFFLICYPLTLLAAYLEKRLRV